MSATKGKWGQVFDLPGVGIHASVLPNGLVLMWGRRDKPTDSLDVHECTPFLWNPKNNQRTPTPQPKLADGTKVNLFCSGHAFLPDGRLLVVGGHLFDGDGVNQASIYDPAGNTWTPTARMNRGRWYPTTTALPDGGVLVLAGSYRADNNGPIVNNDTLQVWKNGAWAPIINTVGSPLNFNGLPLYPRMHVASDGRVFMSGPLEQTYLLRTTGGGLWTPLANPGGKRGKGLRDYCPSVMYDVDKVIYIGGGNDHGTHEPTAAAEVIDLSQNPPRWRETQPMKHRRRQHNATLLPDGSVLVTGGTRGGGGPNGGFNDLGPGRPVHAAELWDPATETWTELATEAEDRCYHAAAVLLPDATVLSAGGGEYRPDNVHENDPKDTKRNAQVFSPPYLFKGARPEITSAPESVNYDATFEVGTSQPNEIGKVSWVRLGSVTHSFDHNQRVVFLRFTAGAGKLTVSAPQSANVCLPGHYMMFVLNKRGVPSVASIIRVQAAIPPAPLAMAAESESLREFSAPVQIFARRAAVVEAAKGTAVTVGITGTCPYGIAACWGGAYEALSQLEAVEFVNPIPDAGDSTAEVFLADERLPALSRWAEQFSGTVNGTYELRGVEVTLSGVIEERDDELFLAGHSQRPAVHLVPLGEGNKVQWNHMIRERKPAEEGEALAYEKLTAALQAAPAGRRVTVTGPLVQAGEGYRLHVRLFNPSC
ncbi:MAG TPA: galactose oxidase-like domain-containing protein [Pyrinomonadaceae bacterium]|nr:galactose oxidase-like domain-containing protein [Pyrinomonadaceae bacterium]